MSVLALLSSFLSLSVSLPDQWSKYDRCDCNIVKFEGREQVSKCTLFDPLLA